MKDGQIQPADVPVSRCNARTMSEFPGRGFEYNDEEEFTCIFAEVAHDKPNSPDVNLESLPPSCLGPDGKLPRMSEEEHRCT